MAVVVAVIIISLIIIISVRSEQNLIMPLGARVMFAYISLKAGKTTTVDRRGNSPEMYLLQDKPFTPDFVLITSRK